MSLKWMQERKLSFPNILWGVVIIVIGTSSMLAILSVLGFEPCKFRLNSKASTGDQLKKIFEAKMAFYRKNAIIRHELNNNTRLTEFKVSILPQVDCPGLVRVGNPADGGKWVCNPFQLNNLPSCTVYSLGLSGDVTFEVELAKIHGGKCRTLGFDSKLQSNLYDKLPNSKAELKYISNIDDASFSKISIPTIMHLNGHAQIDILKMDIEGAEAEVLPPLLGNISASTVNPIFCQILVELHYKNGFNLLRNFEDSGYWLFRLEPNPRCSVCFEVALIHEGCRERFGASPPILKNFD